MSRQTHSLPGYLRKMQMSRAALFIFVEGYSDRYVYSKLGESESQGHGIAYRVVTAEEIHGDGGGKKVLLKFFDYLRHRSSLIDRFKGKTTVSVFFLDKDIDDFLRTLRRSNHVVYTETYELENYLFIHGDLSEAAATSASLDIQSIRSGLSDYTVWRQRAAVNWKEWVKLCVFSHTRGIGSGSYYARPRSQVNNGIYGTVNKNKYAGHISSLKRQSGLPSDQFRRSFTRLSRKVDKIYSIGQHDLIFKGKWYAYFLAEDIQRIAHQRRYNCNTLKQRLLSSLGPTLNFDESWADRFRSLIRSLLLEARG